jgi:hypothetical protein
MKASGGATATDGGKFQQKFSVPDERYSRGFARAGNKKSINL